MPDPEQPVYDRQLTTAIGEFRLTVVRIGNAEPYVRISQTGIVTDTVFVPAASLPEFIAALTEAAALINPDQDADPDKAYSVDDIRKAYPMAYLSWLSEEDARLWQRHTDGRSIPELSAEFQRPPGAIRSRLDKLRFRNPPAAQP